MTIPPGFSPSLDPFTPIVPHIPIDPKLKAEIDQLKQDAEGYIILAENTRNPSPNLTKKLNEFKKCMEELDKNPSNATLSDAQNKRKELMMALMMPPPQPSPFDIYKPNKTKP